PPRLPKKDNPRRALWLENSRRRDASGEGRWDPASKYIYFCSQHFEKSCFEIVGFRDLGVMEHPGVPPKALRSPFPVSSPGFRAPRRPCRLDTPKPPRATRRWSLRTLQPLGPLWALGHPKDTDSHGAPWGSPPGLWGPPRGARGPLPDSLLVATGDEEATATPALPEGDPPAPPRPVSPSLYMLRLPPPAGAYIQSEHSYQVGSALLWKR
ncbi:THAP7 protein, partial [Fregata magnificens]|nr:THAP7 protein [Fregata magnificens]